MAPSQNNYYSIFRALQWLKRPAAFRQRTSFMVDPDPRTEFSIRFGNGSTNIDDKLDNVRDIMILAWNSDHRRVYNPEPASFTYDLSISSELAMIFNRDAHVTRPLPLGCSPGPRAVRKTLIDILDAFPQYDMETDEGIEWAIKDLTRRLGRVTAVEEF